MPNIDDQKISLKLLPCQHILIHGNLNSSRAASAVAQIPDAVFELVPKDAFSVGIADGIGPLLMQRPKVLSLPRRLIDISRVRLLLVASAPQFQPASPLESTGPVLAV
jgi:hypothetical protein